MTTKTNLSTQSSIIIDATAGAIWDVLTDPDKIKIYLFGSYAQTDWQPVSPIIFTRDRIHPSAPKSEQLIIDKGRLLEVEKERLLKFTFYSSMEDYADLPENYSTVTYTIEPENGHRYKLTYLREHIPIEFERINQERFLPGMLQQIKAMAEVH